MAARREADRVHGERVYDASNAIMLWRRLRVGRPSLPDHPRNPQGGFGDDAIALEKRGYQIALREVGKYAASSYSQ